MIHKKLTKWRFKSAVMGILFTVFVGLASQAYADFVSDLGQFWDDMGVMNNVTPAGAYSNQSAGYYTGGSAFARLPQRNYNLLNIQLPRFDAGCGGIDIFMGGFGFIDTQQLIDMIRNIGSNALAYAFGLAIKTVTPLIDDELKSLQKVVNEVNRFNINSCEEASRLVGGAMDLFSDQNNNKCINDRVMYANETREEAQQFCKTGGGADATNAQRRANRNNNPLNDGDWNEFNLSWRALQKAQLTANDTQLAEVFMTLTGTLIRRSIQDPPNSGNVVDWTWDPRPALAVNEDMIADIVEGRGFDYYSCGAQTGEHECLDPQWQNMNAPPPGTSFKEKVSNLLNGIINNIVANDPLDQNQIGLLNSTELPVYKMLNVMTAYNPALARTEAEQYSELIAFDMVYGYINTAVSLVKAASAKMMIDEDIKKDFINQLMQTNKMLLKYQSKIKANVNLQIQMVEHTMVFEKTLATRLSPGISRSMTWGASLETH